MNGESPGNAPVNAGPPDWRVQFLELTVFVVLFLPTLVLSYFEQGLDEASFAFAAFATIFHNVALVGLILYFLWRNGEPLTRIGWMPSRWAGEAGLGLILFIPFAAVTGLFEELFLKMGLSSPSESLPSFLAARGPYEMILAVSLVIVVAVGEEIIYRGYLILRFGSLLKNGPAAAFISSGLFALGHGYEGSAGIATVAVMGLAFAGIYIWRRHLGAPIVMHFLQDFIGIVLAPLISS